MVKAVVTHEQPSGESLLYAVARVTARCLHRLDKLCLRVSQNQSLKLTLPLEFLQGYRRSRDVAPALVQHGHAVRTP
jgi:hypothetical protein